MTARCAAALFAVLLVQGSAAAAERELRPSEVELGLSEERLSGGRADWRGAYLEAMRTLGERRSVHGGVRQTTRFGLHDTQGWAGYVHPLSSEWGAQIEAGVSGEHRVLPRHFVMGELSGRLADGFGVSFGLRYSRFDSAPVRLLVAGGERYFGNFRAAYSLYAGGPQGASAKAAHRVSLNYYYGERSTVGLSIASGQESENAGSPASIVTTSVRNLTLEGRHWLNPAWAVSWSLLTHQQGALYRREGFQIGLRHRF